MQLLLVGPSSSGSPLALLADACREDGHGVVVTHMPCVLPADHGGTDQDDALARAIHRTGARLHVSGHCHWAHGLYHTHEKRVPCVVASVAAHWHEPQDLEAVSGARGDSADASRGGYNMKLTPIVCDVQI